MDCETAHDYISCLCGTNMVLEFINGPMDFRYHAHLREAWGQLRAQYEANILNTVCTPATSDNFCRLFRGYLKISTAFFPSQVFPGREKTRCVAYRSQEDIGKVGTGIEFESVFLDPEIVERGSGFLDVFCAVINGDMVPLIGGY